MSLTGKQKKFLAAYLDGANFNATRAAQLAGYRATSKHSFEAIGSENLTRPGIKQAIDDYFASATVSAEGTLQELAKLARGNSKDKIRALALLSQHHGLLDGTYAKRSGSNEITLKVEYDRGYGACVEDVHKYTEQFNREAEEKNAKIEAHWQSLIERYAHSPDVVEALTELHEVVHGKKEPPPLPEPERRVPEIIPEARRLEAAPIERMMEEVITPEIVEPEFVETEIAYVPVSYKRRCGHGYHGPCSLCNYGFR